MKYVLTVKKKERKGKRSGLPPITTDEVGLLVVSAGDWHGQSRSQRPRSRGPEEEIVAWHEGIAGARVFALVVSFHNVLRLICKLRVRGWTSGAKSLCIKRN